jgi:hypothetical protein
MLHSVGPPPRPLTFLIETVRPGRRPINRTIVPPRQCVGAAAFQKPWQGFLDMFKGPINAEVNDLVINSDGEIAYSRSVQHVSGTTNEGKPFDATFRITDVYRKSHDKWVIRALLDRRRSLPPVRFIPMPKARGRTRRRRP